MDGSVLCERRRRINNSTVSAGSAGATPVPERPQPPISRPWNAEALLGEEQECRREIEPHPAHISCLLEDVTYPGELPLIRFDIDERTMTGDRRLGAFEHPGLEALHVDLDDVDLRLVPQRLVERDHLDVPLAGKLHADGAAVAFCPMQAKEGAAARMPDRQIVQLAFSPTALAEMFAFR